MGDRRGPQLRADDEGPVRPRRRRRAGAGDGGRRPDRTPHVHHGHGPRDPPPVGLPTGRHGTHGPGALRHVRPDRFGRTRLLVRDRPPRVRPDERQRGQGQARIDRRVLRERRRPGQPPAHVQHPRPQQDRNHRLPARRLARIIEDIYDVLVNG